MQIRSAFPRILDREYPVVKPEYPLLTVLYLLRMKEVEAVPLAQSGKGEGRAVFGYSSLVNLLSMGPKRFGAFLKEPCRTTAVPLGSVGMDQDLGSLLDAFGAKRLGCAMVRGPDNRRSLVTLADILDLYVNGSLSTKMRIEDVATPIFSVPGKTPIRDAVRGMFSHRYRRVFISGEDRYVSDRSIMEHLFSPMVLEDIAENPDKDFLATPIERLERIAPMPVGPLTTFKAAARKLAANRGQCLVVNGNEVITQWDLVMKPWLAGKLTIS